MSVTFFKLRIVNKQTRNTYMLNKTIIIYLFNPIFLTNWPSMIQFNHTNKQKWHICVSFLLLSWSEVYFSPV